MARTSPRRRQRRLKATLSDISGGRVLRWARISAHLLLDASRQPFRRAAASPRPRAEPAAFIPAFRAQARVTSRHHADTAKDLLILFQIRFTARHDDISATTAFLPQTVAVSLASRFLGKRLMMPQYFKDILIL